MALKHELSKNLGVHDPWHRTQTRLKTHKIDAKSYQDHRGVVSWAVLGYKSLGARATEKDFSELINVHLTHLSLSGIISSSAFLVQATQEAS